MRRLSINTLYSLEGGEPTTPSVPARRSLPLPPEKMNLYGQKLQYECNECTSLTTFPTKSLLKKHYWSSHGLKNRRSFYPCLDESCPLKFDVRKRMLAHHKEVHKEKVHGEDNTNNTTLKSTDENHEKQRINDSENSSLHLPSPTPLRRTRVVTFEDHSKNIKNRNDQVKIDNKEQGRETEPAALCNEALRPLLPSEVGAYNCNFCPLTFTRQGKN